MAEYEMVLSVIAGSVLSLIGMVLIVQLSTRNWFKKQRFKSEMAVWKKQQDLQLKKLSKSLNVTQNTGSDSGKTPLQGISQYLPLLKNLDPEQLQGLIDGLSGSSDEGSSPDWLSSLLENIPPEMIEKFLAGLSQGASEEKTKEGNGFI